MEHAKQELELTQDKPYINERSQRMSFKDNHIPIYERFQLVQ